MSDQPEDTYKKFFSTREIDCFFKYKLYFVPTEPFEYTKRLHVQVPSHFRRFGFRKQIGIGKNRETIEKTLVCMKNGKVMNEKEFEMDTGLKMKE